MKPTVDYITRVAELIVLSSAFQVAASRTSSIFLDALAIILNFVSVAYAGVAFSIIFLLVERFKTKNLWLALLITVPLGAAIGIGAFEGSRQLSEAIDQIAAIEQK